MPVYDSQGHWDSAFPMDPNKYLGFIYLVTNLLNGKKYVGKKNYKHGGKTYHKRADGSKQTNYRKGTDTNWRDYTGSSEDLNADIEEFGIDNFEFRVIREYKTRGGLHYAECNLQHKRNVLTATLPNGERAYYNKTISAVKFLPKEYYEDVI